MEKEVSENQKQTQFGDSGPVPVRGLYLGKRLHIRALRTREALAPSPLVIPWDPRGCAVLFRYGAVVAFNLQGEALNGLVEMLGPHIHDPFSGPESETLFLGEDDRRSEGLDEEGVLWVDERSVEKLQVVAEVLAKSVVLAQHESQISNAFERLEPLAEIMARGRRPRAGQRTLLKELGNALLAQTRTIGRVEIGEKPDMVWDDPGLDRLYVRLAKEYELRERETALSRKTALISDTTGVLIDLLAQKQTLRVEWYIVILIVIEIVIILYDLILMR